MAEVMPLILISLRSTKRRRIYDTNKEITVNKMSVWATVKNVWARVLLCFCLTSSHKATEGTEENWLAAQGKPQPTPLYRQQKANTGHER